MDKIIEFIGNNYAWFLTITIILLFALIGYIYDNRESLKTPKEKVSKKESIKEREEEQEEVIVKEITNQDIVKETLENTENDEEELDTL